MRTPIESRLEEIRIELPDATQSDFQERALRNGNKLVYVSGQSSFGDQSGKIGTDVSIEEGKELTRRCALNVLANLKVACGSDLDRVVQCVKVTAFINANSDFREHPRVLDSASDLLVEIFAQAGAHARSAVGTDDIPSDTAIRIDAIFEIRVADS